ncbi:WSC domain-containing protein [Cladorrhinum sp. PSN259]|nr:WSC domain-containing protein [Cladorrhinum sp. PSN259]
MPAIRNVAAAAMAVVAVVKATEVFLPPCLDPFQPFVYSGCYAEASGTQILPYRSPAQSSDMTVEKCVAECKGNGYRYAGLVYYGVCYCGQTVNGAATEETSCSLPCNGDNTETCGGNGAFSIYQDPTFQPVDSVTIEDYDSLGCWTDESSLGRALTYRQNQVDGSSMTTESCLQACKSGGFPFAGTQYGGECYCGVVIGNGTFSAPAEECNMPCNGNSDEICGGRSRLNLFAADELLSLEPCGYVPPVVSSSSSVAPEPTTTTTVEPEPTSSEEPTTTSECTTTSTTTSTTAPPPTSTTAPPTTSKPPTTTSGSTSTTKTTSSICTTTTVVPPTCEYKCGKWCSNPIPSWGGNANDCKAAFSSCTLQVASCFKQAGFPDVLECFNFGSWCSDVEKYCRSTPSGSKSSFCGRNPPKHPNPPKSVTSTITVPCAVATSTRPATTTSQAPIPTPTNICKQPTNSYYGYAPGKPVAGIELPIVTCNDLADQYHAGYPFKLYNEPSSRNCKKYTRPQCNNACADACKEQYEDCIDVYAETCRRNTGFGGFSWPRAKPRSAKFASDSLSEVEKRTFGWTDNYNGAVNKCKAQYNDCLTVNKQVSVTGKCPSFGRL